MDPRESAGESRPHDEHPRLPPASDDEIDALYERAYRGVDDPLGEEFEGWAEEGAFNEHAGSPDPPRAFSAP